MAPVDSFDSDAVSALRHAVAVLARRLRNQSSGDELSATELAVLGRVRRDGQHTPGQLAKAEHVQPPSMTRIVERLEFAGYLHREPHPDDGRQQLISITEGGLDFVVRTRERRNQWLADQLAQLTGAERASVLAALPALARLADLP